MTWIGILGLIAAGTLAAGFARTSRRSRVSIEGMLDASRPCAVRIRRLGV